MTVRIFVNYIYVYFRKQTMNGFSIQSLKILRTKGLTFYNLSTFVLIPLILL